MLKPVAVRVTGCIQPWHRKPLTVMLAVEQAVDETLIGEWIAVIDKRIDLLRGGRQAEKVGMQSANQGHTIRLKRRRQFRGFEFGKNEPVNLAPNPFTAFHRRRTWTNGSDKRPVILERCTIGNPSSQQVLFGR